MSEGKSAQDYVDEAQDYLEMKDKAEELKVTEQEINKVIAEFMGWEFIDWDAKNHPHISGHSMVDNANGVIYPGLRFTQSLDALVPVWEKLECDIHGYIGKQSGSYDGNDFSIDYAAGHLELQNANGATIQLAAAHATAKAIMQLNKTLLGGNMNSYKVFQSSDEFNIAGRGRVFVVNVPLDEDLPSLGEYVIIDNGHFEVMGIEMMGVSGKRTNPNVGLLVKSSPKTSHK